MANWTNVTREPETGLPTMLVQAVSIAFVMCVCELVSVPVMVSAAGGAFALMPWFLSPACSPSHSCIRSDSCCCGRLIRSPRG